MCIRDRYKHDIKETEEKMPPFCTFYNNSKCTNDECTFSHKDAPYCRNDGDCQRKLCMFKHKKQDFQKWNPVRPAERLFSMKTHQQTRRTAYKGPVWEKENRRY